MAVTQVEKYLECVFEIEGASDRSWSFTETYALSSQTLDASTRSNVLWLAKARATFLNDDCNINTVRVTEWPAQRRSIIINDTPIVGTFVKAATGLAVTGMANVTLSAGANNTANGSVGTFNVPAEADLDIHNPQSCLNFYLEGSDFRTATRQISGIPDLFINDLKANGMPANQTWLLTPAAAPNSATDPVTKADFYANIKAFWEGVRAWCVIPAQTNPKNEAKRDLATIERVVYRGVGQRPVGPPKKVFRGRHAIQA